MANIIYILPSEKGPAGGIKVTLQHAELINKIQKKNLSKVIFIKKKKTSKWKGSVDKFFDLKSDKESTGWKFNQITVDKKNKTKWFNKNTPKHTPNIPSKPFKARMPRGKSKS